VPEFLQRALIEVVLLGVAGGLLGTWIVLRRLAFFTHAAGSATFPGLVVAGPWGLPAQVAALGAGLIYATGLERLTSRRRVAPDAATALLLVTALALGTVLASDVFPDEAVSADRLLFGTLLGIGDDDLAWSAGVAALAVVATVALGRTWLATGFEPGAARALGVRGAAGDAMLLAALAIAVVATLPAVGALLAGTLLVIPAATARVLTDRLAVMRALAVGLAIAEGVGGLMIAYETDLPPGPAIAVLGGLVFAAAAVLGARR
jgi:ABC-type Mn2+/Zn2+ transport system permease subunit